MMKLLTNKSAATSGGRSFTMSLPFLFVVLCTMLINTQTTAQCTYSFPTNFDAQINLSSIINCPDGNVILNNANDKNGLSTVTFDSDVTFNSFVVNYKSGSNPLEFIIPSGVTVTITTNMSFNVNSAPQEKFLTVEGTLIVGETLDFGDIEFEIDGTGTIQADAIVGASKVSCSTSSGGTSTCPTIITNSCEDSGGGFCNSGDVLPVELVFFKANVINDKVKLMWQTASEENNDYFTIEKSSNGIDYDEIATVTGAGTHAGNLDYSFIDSNPYKGRSYYRLAQTDYDGTRAYIGVVSIYHSTVSELAVYPNPVSKNGTITVQTGADHDEVVEVNIYSASGVLVKSNQVLGVGQVMLKSELEAGFYTVQIKSGQVVKSTRLIIQ